MGLQDLVRWLLPKEDHFYGFLEDQAVAAHEGATALAAFSAEGAVAAGVAQTVQAVEHKGDAIVHSLEEALAKTFVTPIDREDLQKLSSQLDDVLDLTNGAARGCVLFGVARPTPAMIALTEKLVACTLILKDALPHLRNHEYSSLIDASRVLRKLEKEGDTIYREAIRELFSNEKIDARVLFREKQVLDDLETAIDHCEYVSDTLANLAVKNG
jgi:uncharacterized protein Yka (UPF0111/DUF47 family)